MISSGCAELGPRAHSSSPVGVVLADWSGSAWPSNFDANRRSRGGYPRRFGGDLLDLGATRL